MNIDNLTPESLPEYLVRIFLLKNRDIKFIKLLIQKNAFKSNIEKLVANPLATPDAFITITTLIQLYTNSPIYIKKIINELTDAGLLASRRVTFIDENQKKKAINVYYFPFNSFTEMWKRKKNDIAMKEEEYDHYFNELDKNLKRS